MEKAMKKVFCLVLLVLCLLPVFSSDRLSIFIDISGSMDSQLSEIKKYVTEDYIPSLKPDTELKIYKFYGKIRPPIYDGNLNSDSKIFWAKKQVNSLAANGPWTNIEGVLDYISANCIDYGDKFLVLTDGKNEADEKSKVFEITDSLIKEKLGDNARLVSHGKWKSVEFSYEQKTSKVSEPTIDVQPQKISEKSEEKTVSPVNSVKTVSKKNTTFKKFIIPIPPLLIILIILLFFKNKSLGSGSISTSNHSFSKDNCIARLPKGQIKAASISNYSDAKSSEKVNQNLLDRKIKHTPTTYGEWTEERGNSTFKPTKEGIEEYLKNGGFKDIDSDRKIIYDLLKKYGIEGIEYKNGEPDFSPISEFSTPITEKLTGDFHKNVPIMHRMLADAMNKSNYLGRTDWTKESVRDYVSQNWLVLHESIDGQIQLIHWADIRNNV
jgi:hypothetical protein